MALISCTECGNRISDKAVACPRCGAPPSPPPAAASEPVEPQPGRHEETPAGSNFADIRFSQARRSARKPRSVWPKLLLVGLVVAGGFVLFQIRPASIARFVGPPPEPTTGAITEARRNSAVSVRFRGVEHFDNNLLEVVEVLPVRVTEVPFPERKRYRVEGQTVLALRASGAVAFAHLQSQEAARSEQKVSLSEHYQRIGQRIGLHLSEQRMLDWKAGERETFKDEFVIEWCGDAWRVIERRCSADALPVVPASRFAAMQQEIDRHAEAARRREAAEREQMLEESRQQRQMAEQALLALQAQIREDIAELRRCSGPGERSFSVACYDRIRSAISDHLGRCRVDHFYDSEQSLCPELRQVMHLTDEFRERARAGRLGVREECLDRDCPASFSAAPARMDRSVRILKPTVGMRGPVRIAVDVDGEGKVTGHELLASSGSPELDGHAGAYAHRWNFHPASRGGIPAAGRVELTVTYAVVGEDPVYGSMAKLEKIEDSSLAPP